MKFSLLTIAATAAALVSASPVDVEVRDETHLETRQTASGCYYL